VTKTATLLDVSRAAVSKVTLGYTKRGKTASAMRNSGRKSTLTERDHHTFRRIVLKNHTTTAAHITAELNIHHEDPVSTKTIQCELHKSNIHDSSRAAFAKPLITESDSQMHKQP
jgi:predicted transcriptional regulator